MKGQRFPVWLLLLTVAIVSCLVGWLIFRGVREGFQSELPADSVLPSVDDRLDLLPNKLRNFAECVPSTDKPAIAARFWKIVAGLASKMEEGVTSMEDTIRMVTDPKQADTYQLIFPTYISAYALAKYWDNPNINHLCARTALFNEYDSLMKDLTTTVYDPKEIAKWNADPKEQTCVALKVIEENIAQALSNMRRNIQDVSGTTVSLAALRDENLGFQNKFLQACKATTPPNEPCIQLASQEPILFPLLASYEGAQASAYDAEGDLNDSLQAVGETYKILGCAPGKDIRFNFDSDRDLGQIDAEALRIKLQTLSPYYLSPDTLKYITDILINSDDVDNSLMNTSDILANVNLSVKNIKGITGV